MLTVRPLDIADLEPVRRVISAALRTLSSQEGWTEDQLAHMMTDHTSEEDLRELFRKQVWFVACQGDHVVGVLSLWRNEIARLYVDPVCHRRGIGRALFNVAERTVKASGFSEICARSFSASVPFYTAVGMCIRGQEPCRGVPFTGREVSLMVKEL